MSHAPSPADSHDHGTVASEKEVNSKLIITVGVVSLILFAISAIAAAVILNKDTAAYDAAGVPPAASLIYKPEVGIVEQIHYDLDKRLPVWQADKQRRLREWNWADRNAGLVRMPIDEAMKEVVRQGGGAK